MRRLLLTLVLGSALVGAGAAPAANGPTTTLVITVKSVLTSSSVADKPPKGPSKGDRFILRDRLVNVARQFGKPAGAAVGLDEGILVILGVNLASSRGVATLPGGTIRFAGTSRISGAGVTRFPVTGGTGRYAGARGTLIIGPGATNNLNTYRLVLPATTTTV